jgi:hypothetical protein
MTFFQTKENEGIGKKLRKDRNGIVTIGGLIARGG